MFDLNGFGLEDDAVLDIDKLIEAFKDTGHLYWERNTRREYIVSESCLSIRNLAHAYALSVWADTMYLLKETLNGDGSAAAVVGACRKHLDDIRRIDARKDPPPTTVEEMFNVYARQARASLYRQLISHNITFTISRSVLWPILLRSVFANTLSTSVLLLHPLER